MWINWIKTQSFVPEKLLSSCGNNLHPSTAVLIFSQTLSACGCRLRFTKAGHSCRTLEWFSPGVLTPLYSGTPKIFFFALLQGTVWECFVTSPGWARHFQSQKRSTCSTKSWEKRHPPKVDPNLQPYLQINISSFVCARCTKAAPALNRKGAKVGTE